MQAGKAQRPTPTFGGANLGRTTAAISRRTKPATSATDERQRQNHDAIPAEHEHVIFFAFFFGRILRPPLRFPISGVGQSRSQLLLLSTPACLALPSVAPSCERERKNRERGEATPPTQTLTSQFRDSNTRREMVAARRLPRNGGIREEDVGKEGWRNSGSVGDDARYGERRSCCWRAVRDGRVCAASRTHAP